MRLLLLSAALGLFLPGIVLSDSDVRVVEKEVVEWKAVFGKVEARDKVPARSRIGGTIADITVTEGTLVKQGQKIGEIFDAKLKLQLQSIDAQIAALSSQLENAEAELKRGEDLLKRGVTTIQRLDGLRTQVSVLTNQIESTRAQKRVVEQQAAEGAVLAPIGGTVLNVPLTTGSVVMPGELIAMIGGGGFYLRLAVPERHAAFLKEGDPIQIGAAGNTSTGKLAKVYPQIENGRAIADVELTGMSADFVDARVLVRLPIAKTRALLVPTDLIVTRMGLDFVTVKTGEGQTGLRNIVPGELHMIDGQSMTEVLSGVVAGEIIVETPKVSYTPAKDHGHE